MTMDDREKLVRQAISHFSHGISHDIFSEPVTTYAKLAIEALEKQTPKKPIKSYGSTIRYCEVWKCPICGFEWSGGVADFCYRCGQAIDWR